MNTGPTPGNQQFAAPSSRPVVPQGVSPAGRPPQLQAQNQQINLQQQLNAQNAANQLQQNRQRQAINQARIPPNSVAQGQTIVQQGGLYMRPPQLVASSQGIRDLQPVGTVQFGGNVINPQLVGPMFVTPNGQPVRQIVTSNQNIVRLPNGTAVLAGPQQFIGPANGSGPPQAYAATLQAGPNQQHQIVLYNPQMCVPTSMMYVPQQGAGTQQATIQQISTISPNMHPILTQQLAQQTQSNQNPVNQAQQPPALQIALTPSQQQQKAPEVAKVEPFPHISKETASSKESPFSDCPTLKPANAEDAEEIDEPPPLLDRVSGDDVVKSSESKESYKEMPTIDAIEEKFIMEAMEFKNRNVVPKRSLVHEIDGMVFEESSTPFPVTQLKQKLKLGKGRFIKEPLEFKPTRKERHHVDKDEDEEMRQEQDGRRRRQRRMFGKGDDSSQKRIMTRARRSDGKEKDEPTTSREYRNDRDGKEERDDRKGDKPKKRRTNELEKLLHMDFGPKEGGKRLLAEMENKKRSSGGEKEDEDQKKKSSPGDEEKKRGKRSRDMEEDNSNDGIKREEDSEEADSSYCLWCKKLINNSNNQSSVQFCSNECRKRKIASKRDRPDTAQSYSREIRQQQSTPPISSLSRPYPLTSPNAAHLERSSSAAN
ncbi:hypothetical protein WR25_11046 isoform A [Diploscapter pachys]|uniref:Uncharacterized protein n=2 Tax=Diploscapter pachys TaxID=2018661 RepID=A0A2A2LTG1_9BILA|nr:hypothetical protein WR25_11046 isoform A [Diploscapter pachys]